MAREKMAIFLVWALLFATASNATPVMVRRDTAASALTASPSTASPSTASPSLSAGHQCMPITAQELSAQLLGLQQGNDTSFEPDFPSVNTAAGTGTAAIRPCPHVNASIDASMAVNERAVCPWDYQRDENPDRIPRIVHRAVHRCNDTGKCLHPRTGAEIPDANCEPIIYRMKVLNRTECADGNYTYRVEYLPIPVAFTCSRPVTRPQ